MDEAHKLLATVSGGVVRATRRFQLGRLLSNVTRHYLLLTATPHNGKEEDFQLFLSLVDIRSSRQHLGYRTEHLRRFNSEVLGIPIERNLARLIMVAQESCPPSIFPQLIICLDYPLLLRKRRPGCHLDNRGDKWDAHIELMSGLACKIVEIRKLSAIDLAHRHHRVRLENPLVQFSYRAMGSWKITADIHSEGEASRKRWKR